MSNNKTVGMTEKVVDINGHAVMPLVHTWQVIEQQIWSKTELRSSSARTYMGPYGGYVQMPQLTSKVTEQQEIWLRDEQGKETPLRLNNGGIAVRAGHRLTLSGIEVHGQSWLVDVQNSDTGQRKRMIKSWGHLLHHAGVLPRPSWLDLSNSAKGMRIFAFSMIGGLLALLLLLSAYRLGLAPLGQTELLENQIRALEHQSIETSGQRARRNLEQRTQELYQALSAAQAEERREVLLWVNGLGVAFLLSGIAWQKRRVRRYRRHLGLAEQRLEQYLNHLYHG